MAMKAMMFLDVLGASLLADHYSFLSPFFFLPFRTVS